MTRKTKIIELVGAPETGKTVLGPVIAKSLGGEYINGINFSYGSYSGRALSSLLLDAKNALSLPMWWKHMSMCAHLETISAIKESKSEIIIVSNYYTAIRSLFSLVGGGEIDHRVYKEVLPSACIVLPWEKWNYTSAHKTNWSNQFQYDYGRKLLLVAKANALRHIKFIGARDENRRIVDLWEQLKTNIKSAGFKMTEAGIPSDFPHVHKVNTKES